MTESVYTLLIVESPVMAGIIQSVCPSSVYVLATGGFCWQPEYDPLKHRLKAVADPEKSAIRKELKEQAQWANSVIIAADSDPAGDFITWSIATYLKKPGMKRTSLQSLSKTGIIEMLNESREFDATILETRLLKSFMIRQEWKRSRMVPDFQLSGLISIFGHAKTYRHFLDENGTLFKSSSPLNMAPDEWIPVITDASNDYYCIGKPLSTFDLLGKIVSNHLAVSYQEAQDLLQELFRTKLPFSDESLISYPRTGAKAFYSETWNHIRQQYIRFGSQNELKPVFMQEIADTNTPHESIHPINLALTPDNISGELSGSLGKLYRLIYEHTRTSITMPVKCKQAFTNQLQSGVYFYSADGRAIPESGLSLRPVYTTSDLGLLLYDLGISRPSGFGKDLDDWESRGWIVIEMDIVTPGEHVLKRFNHAESLFNKLKKLNLFTDSDTFSDIETVKRIISS